MEDVDVAIPKSSNEGLNRDREIDDVKKDEKKGGKGDRGSSGGSITLSGKRIVSRVKFNFADLHPSCPGLLNAIDGISGSDGRLLFMTT